MGLTKITFSDGKLKPREKARYKGIENLDDYELLALIFDTGTSKENVLDLACRYIQEKGGLRGIFLSTEVNLYSEGVKEAKVFRLLAIREIMVRLPFSPDENLKNASEIYEKTRPAFCGLNYEKAIVFYLDTTGKVLRKEEICNDKSGYVAFSADKIVKNAIYCLAKAVCFIHNHPSGQLFPSADDKLSARRLKERLASANIVLLDSIICTTSGYYSLRENGVEPFL